MAEGLIMVYASGNLAVLNDVTEAQCAEIVMRHPDIHIFIEEENE